MSTFTENVYSQVATAKSFLLAKLDWSDAKINRLLRNIFLMMLRKTLKVLPLIAFMWIIYLVTIINENNDASAHDDSDTEIYEKALSKFKRKYSNNSVQSDFQVWQLLSPVNIGLSMDEKLSIIKGYDFPPGVNGRPVVLEDALRTYVKQLVKKGWKEHAFNEFVSDLIPVNRSLMDPRDEWCKYRNYLKKLPKATVIICFHNEAWSTLIRTVTSVMDRSPTNLLEQIVLVDDFSNMAHLKERLDEYVYKVSKLKLVRTSQREGLIRARIIGIKHTNTPVLIYLDSHCECAKGWLEPLLERIAEDPTRVVSPVVDNIHENTFEYISQDVHDLRIGGFNWELKFIWKAIPHGVIATRKNLAAPIQSPTISGGLFAINKDFFQKLGYYDSGFDVWGAENLELSLKTWMCGGSLEIVPCSHVGHVFRNKFPYEGPKESSKRNFVRLAKVWLDDYAKYFYQRIGNDIGDFGDVSQRKKLRHNLKCKSFQWYLDNIYPEMEIPSDYVASGQIYNLNNGLCLDYSNSLQIIQENAKLVNCHFQGGNQYWTYTKDGEIRRDGMCLDNVLNTVVLFLCHGRRSSQTWLYNIKTKTIKHVMTRKCLSVRKYRNGYKLGFKECFKSINQKWMMENFVSKRFELLTQFVNTTIIN